MQIALVSVVQIAVSIILTAIALYLGIWLFERSTRQIDEWKALRQGNAAVGLTLASVVVGLAIILRPAIAGDLPATYGRMAPDLAPVIATIVTLLLILARTLFGLFLGVMAILIAVWLFTHLTNEVDEMAELKQGNTAVAIMFSGVILAISLLGSPAVSTVTNGLMALFLP